MTSTSRVRAPRPARLGYQPALDGLRALSVVAVILYHAGVSWMPGGFLGVEVFFVVSGFLITALLLEERSRSGGIDLRQFWIRRARRLLPALYLLLAVVSVASLLAWRDAAGRLGGDVLAALIYVSNWWQILLDESYFAQSGRPPLLLHLWSLAVEEQFYVLFPPLFALGLVTIGRVRTRTVVAVLAVTSAVWMAVLYRPFEDTTRVYYGTDTRAAGLLVGVVLAMVWTPWRSRARAAWAAGPTLDAIGVIGLIVIGWYLVRVNAFDGFIYRGGLFLLDLVCIVVIAVLVHPDTRLSKLMAWAPLVWIGVRSYSLYLWHWPIFQVTRPDLDVPLSGFPLFVLRLALTFGAAELSFRYVETPLRQGALGRWWDGVRVADPAQRGELRRRGATIGATFAVLVLLLGWGLHAAASNPDRAEIELAAAGASADDVPAAVLDAPADDDPSAPVTTDTTSTTTTVAPPAPGGPTTTAVPVRSDAVAVGDSVMLGAQDALNASLPGMRVDVKVGRQFDSVLDVIGWYVREGYVPGALVVHAGTNGTFDDSDLDRLVELAGDRRVLLVNAKVARPWEGLVNQRISAAADRHESVELVDWFSLASAHPEWFTGDGAHLRPDGARAYAELLRSSLDAGS